MADRAERDDAVIDVVVIGAGAAGLMAAATAAQHGAGRVVLLEKNRKAGTKILMSGGSRCNLTHDCDPSGIMAGFGRQGRFLRQTLAALSPQQTVAMFHRLGVPTKVESTGKVFPQNDSAVGVRDALQRQAEAAGAELWLAAGVTDLWRTPQGFGLATPRGELRASRVIVTVGGKSWPKCGTTGDGYGWLERLGHVVEPLRPALVPLVGGEAWSQALSGLTLDRVRLAAWRPRSGRSGSGKRPAAEREGGFLFTHFGFSGPVVMDLSREWTFGNGQTATRLTAQFLPAETAETLRQQFAARRQQQGGQTVATMLADRLPRRLAECLADRQGIAERPLAEAPKRAMAALIDSLVGLELPVRATRGFEKAEVTAGGVRLKEIDPRTMESRLVPGLFIAGELLDLDGWIGGYNFQAAFSTGWTAGRAVAAASTEEPV